MLGATTSVSVFVTTAILCTSLASQELDFPGFSDVAGLQFNGDATLVDNSLRISRTGEVSAGSVFTLDNFSFGQSNSFLTYFQFQISNSGGIGDSDGPGADGLVFVIQAASNNAIGAPGGDNGYSGIFPSLGIEFDTFANPNLFDDPNGNHVGVNLDGSLFSVATANEPVRFNNGEIWNVWVAYNGQLDELDVRWSMQTPRPENPMMLYTVDLESVLGQQSAFVGFTSATFSAFGNHDLLRWHFVSGNSQVGDLNCDGQVNLLDVTPFVDAISQTDYTLKADINFDGVVDLLDIAPFVDLLTGG